MLTREEGREEGRRVFERVSCSSTVDETETRSEVSGGATNPEDCPSNPLNGAAVPGSGQALHGAGAGPLPAESPTATRPWRVGAIYPILPAGRLSFTVHDSEAWTREQIAAFPNKYFFSSDFPERYEPFCADFGPVSLGVVHKFCLFIRELLNDKRLDKRELVYFTEEPVDVRTNAAILSQEEPVDVRTNAAFLLAAFLVLDLRLSPEEAWAPFGSITGDAFATFRDATWAPQDYELRILDCLRGLSKAVECGFYDAENFDVEDYHYLENPANADMNMCTPKLAAFRGPTQQPLQPAVPGLTSFPPSHFVELFKDTGITAVIRLSGPEAYDPAGFTEHGIAHDDLDFPTAIPSIELVLKFLSIVESAENKVAVHCTAGLARTGVMIAAYMMKHHGFTAAESIGWLRIVRPGSVIGEQQHCLHVLERALSETEPSDHSAMA